MPVAAWTVAAVAASLAAYRLKVSSVSSERHGRRRCLTSPAHANKIVRDNKLQKLGSKKSGLNTIRAARTINNFTDGRI
jgi:hypothetical protein